jgi:hypothetical protein
VAYLLHSSTSVTLYHCGICESNSISREADLALAGNRMKFRFLVLNAVDVTIVRGAVRSTEGDYFVSLDETGLMRVSFSCP